MSEAPNEGTALDRTHVHYGQSPPTVVYDVDGVLVGVEGRTANDVGAFVVSSLVGGTEAAAAMSRSLLDAVLEGPPTGADLERLVPIPSDMRFETTSVIESQDGQESSYTHALGFERREDRVRDLGESISAEEALLALDVVFSPVIARSALDAISDDLDDPNYLSPIDEEEEK